MDDQEPARAHARCEQFLFFLREKEQKDRFVRWQRTTMDQLGYAMNLILTFSVASLGFGFSLLRDSGFVPGCVAKCTLLFSFLTLATSVLCGIFGTITRLLDFRGSARRAGSHPDKPSKSSLDLIGKATWVFFYSELATFLAGAVLLGLTLGMTYGSKLA